MQWTRRQFGLWSSAALLTSHRAFAGSPEQGQKAEPPKAPEGYDALALEVRLQENEPTRLRFDVAATNVGTRGQTFHYELDGATLVDASGKELDLGPGVGHEVVAYFEQRHPYARRLITPSYVDIAPGKSVSLAAILVDVPGERPEGGELRLTIGLYRGMGPVERSVPVNVPWPGKPDA